MSDYTIEPNLTEYLVDVISNSNAYEVTIEDNSYEIIVDSNAETYIVPVESINYVVDVSLRNYEVAVNDTAYEITVVQGLPGPQGEQGLPGINGDGSVVFPFSYGDATPAVVTNLADDYLIVTATIIISTVFNGMNASLQLGTNGIPDLLISTTQNDPTMTQEFRTFPGNVILSGNSIILTISPGAGATQGSGFVVLEMSLV